MAQIDVIDALAHNEVEYEGVENPGDEGMGIEAVLGVLDITKAEEIQLLQTSATCCIDREEDGKRHKTADKTDGHGNFEISEQEEAIESVVIQNIAVWDLIESANPIEHAIGEIWRPLPVRGVCQSNGFGNGR